MEEPLFQIQQNKIRTKNQSQYMIAIDRENWWANAYAISAGKLSLILFTIWIGNLKTESDIDRYIHVVS